MRRPTSWAIAVAFLSIPPIGSGCTQSQLQTRASSYAIIDSLSGSAGARPLEFDGSLRSDVITMVGHTENGQIVRQPAALEDAGRVAMHLALIDPGPAAQPTTPSTTNSITFTRYRVTYMRADGRNVEGTDVPYSFDGGLTMTVTGGSAVVATFVLVRAQAKQEAPLQALYAGGGARTISTIAQVTFYGTDQAGRAAIARGNISIQFSDWPDAD